MEKKKIGMIVAVEIDAVLNKYGPRLEKLDYTGFDVSRIGETGYDLYIVKSGAGEIAAASSAQFLISEIGADMIVNFGVVGGLTEEMTVAKLAVVTDVVHYDFDVSEWIPHRKAQYINYPSVYIPTTKALWEAAIKLDPTLKPVICASADKFIASPERKRELHEEFNADICEMEAAGIVLTCNRNEVPCLLIKAVSDSMSGGAEEFSKECSRCAGICLDMLAKLIAADIL